MDKSFALNNTTIRYLIQGQGQPVVLLHGFGEDSSVWQKQRDALSSCCMVIVPDLPGSGRSSFIEKEDVSIEDYADWLHALLNHEKISKCILLGHSMGGYITLAFAEIYPERLDGFGLIHSTAFADSEEKKETRKQGIKLIREHGAFSFLKNTIPNLFSKEFKTQYSNKVAAFIEKGKQFSNEALIQYYTAMMNRSDRSAVLKSSQVPVMFITGTEDNAAPLNDLLQQVHLPAISHIHILENTGHMGMMEKPNAVNAFLIDFCCTN